MKHKIYLKYSEYLLKEIQDEVDKKQQAIGYAIKFFDGNGKGPPGGQHQGGG